jgi:transglutaminase-like putative cysteine protease
VSVRSYRVAHRTRYEYGATMSDGYSVTCLVPRATDEQTIVSSGVTLDPAPSAVDSDVDVFGNHVHHFGLHEPHDAMTVLAESVVAVEHREPPSDSTPWEDVVSIAATATGDAAIDLGMFRSSSALVDLGALRHRLEPLARASFTPGRGIVDGAAALCTALNAAFEFDPHFSNVSTPLAEVLAAERGVCQDFAHVAIGCLRSLGLAARYVSGYIETVPPPGRARLVGADASHAWVSVWTPEAGWVDFDPTNGHLPVNDHVTVAWGRDYADVIPVRGVMIGPASTQHLHVAVDVERVS